MMAFVLILLSPLNVIGAERVVSVPHFSSSCPLPT